MLSPDWRRRAPTRRGRAVLASNLAAVAVAATLGASSASAGQPDIEGVWSFDGGTVIVAPNPAGQLVGTVASPTTFVNCTHPVGQAIWTDLQATAGGAYSGLHQWYHGEGSDCTPEPELGPTAFRVLVEADGSHMLRVCFNRPGTTFPSIAADGTPSNVNFGCSDSTPVSGIPTTHPSFSGSIGIPASGAEACLSRRIFKIHVREPKHDPFVKLGVHLDGRPLRIVRHGQVFSAIIDLRGLARGTSPSGSGPRRRPDTWSRVLAATTRVLRVALAGLEARAHEAHRQPLPTASVSARVPEAHRSPGADAGAGACRASRRLQASATPPSTGSLCHPRESW